MVVRGCQKGEGPTAKGAIGTPGQHNGAYRVGGIEIGQDGNQVVDHGLRERIALSETVKTNQRNARVVVDGVLDVL